MIEFNILLFFRFVNHIFKKRKEPQNAIPFFLYLFLKIKGQLRKRYTRGGNDELADGIDESLSGHDESPVRNDESTCGNDGSSLRFIASFEPSIGSVM